MIRFRLSPLFIPKRSTVLAAAESRKRYKEYKYCIVLWKKDIS